MQLASEAGFELVGRYGGRIIMDLIADDAVKYDADTYAAIEQFEIAVCGTSPYRDIGRFWQLVCRRTAD